MKGKITAPPPPQGECCVHGGLRTYPSPSRPRQSHPQPSVELEVPGRRLRSAKVVHSIGDRRPPPVHPRACAQRGLGALGTRRSGGKGTERTRLGASCFGHSGDGDDWEGWGGMPRNAG